MVYGIEDSQKEHRILFCPDRYPFNNYKVGEYVRLLRNRILIEDIKDIELVARPDSEGNIIDPKNGSIIEFLKATNEYLNEIVQTRQNQLAAVEYSR